MLLLQLDAYIRHFLLEQPPAEIVDHQLEEYYVDAFGLFCLLAIGYEVTDEEVADNGKVLGVLVVEGLKIGNTSFFLAEAVSVHLLSVLKVTSPGQSSKQQIVLITFL